MNAQASLANFLANAGYDVVYVGDWKQSASDEEVLRKAEQEQDSNHR